MGFHMNETTDMPKNAESGNWEISDEAMRKFDKLMETMICRKIRQILRTLIVSWKIHKQNITQVTKND